jgi:response regulator RpfG family c-di-GMP phosphodiesterase
MSAQTNGRAGLRPRLLCVDDEPHVLEGLRDVLCRRFDVRVATSGVEGLELLQTEPDAFAVVISDMRMPQMAGAEFLRAARTIAPDTTRMLLTGHADLEAAIRAVNGARLFRFLTKPCDAQELIAACTAAVDQHRVQTAERDLLEQTLRGSVDALAEVLALANPVAFGRGGRVKELAGRLARAVELPDWWEVEVAAMLAHIGAVTLPQPTAEKLYAGAPLTGAEAEMVARAPLITRALLSKIPRLEGVIEILAKYTQPLAAENEPENPIPVGSRVLRIASDYADLEAEHADADVALGAMRGRGIYDQQLLRVFAGLVGAGLSAPVREVCVCELSVGTMLVEDVRSVGGVLLVARGQRVTEQLIERLMNLTTGFVHEPLRVSVAERRA